MNLHLSVLPSVADLSHLCERDGVGERFEVTQPGTSELEFGLGYSRSLCSAHHALLLSLASLSGPIGVSVPGAENSQEQLCSAQSMAASRDAAGF